MVELVGKTTPLTKQKSIYSVSHFKVSHLLFPAETQHLKQTEEA
jgi:hypothetical protein